MEILLFLPAKSLISFKLASKHWRSLISSMSFSHHHAYHHRGRRLPQHSFFLRAVTYQYYVCDASIRRLIPFRFRFPVVKILQSRNGLLLLRCRNTPYGRNDYYIFNPTAMQSRNLMLTCRYISGLCLIFDPSESPHCTVVCFKYSASFLVYHSEKHKWKGVHFNDGIYCVRTRNSSFFNTISDPPRLHSPGAKKNYTMESNGFLHHVRLSLKSNKNRLHVYETKEIKCGWSKKHRAKDFDPISAAFSGNNGTAIELLGMIRGEMINDSILLFHVPGKIMIYRFSDKVFEVLLNFRREYYFQEDRLQFEFNDTHQFIYSLAPVSSIFS